MIIYVAPFWLAGVAEVMDHSSGGALSCLKKSRLQDFLAEGPEEVEEVYEASKALLESVL